MCQRVALNFKIHILSIVRPCPFMHKSSSSSSSRCKSACLSLSLTFLANSVPPSNGLHFAFEFGHLRSGKGTRTANERTKGNVKYRYINLFKIQIKYKFAVAYCLLLQRVGGFASRPSRGIDFVFCSFHSARAILSQQDQTDTIIINVCVRWLLAVRFSWIILLWIYWCVAFWAVLCCVRPALTARVWLLTYLFLVDVDVERDWKTEWMCADSYSTHSARALARSKAFSFELLAGFGRRILCVHSCHVNRQFWRIINSVVAFKKHSTNETERTENGTNGTNGIETRNEINKSFISFDFSRFFDCYRSPLLPCCPLTRLF